MADGFVILVIGATLGGLVQGLSGSNFGMTSTAVSRPAKDSEMISVRLSGVMTMPLGNWMSSATRRSSPSGVTSLM